MTLSAAALTTVAKAKQWLRLEDNDPLLQADGITVFCDATDATAATVRVTDTTVVLVITGGASAGTNTLTLSDAANDTLTELAAVIEALAGWSASLVGKGDISSGDLFPIAATSALAETQRQTLRYVANELLEQVIEGVTKEIERFLGYGVLTATYTGELYYVPIGRTPGELVLNNKEVTAITRIAVDTHDAMRVKYTGSDTDAWVEVTDAAVKTISRAGATTTTTSSTFAANVTIAAMVTTVDALSGWDAESIEAGPSAFLVREGVRVAKDTWVTLEAWENFDGDYEVDYGAGIVRLDWSSSSIGGSGRRRVAIDYVAGEATTPYDIEVIAREMIAETWSRVAGGSTEGIKSETLGEHTITYGGETASVSDRPDWERRLSRLRRWRA